MTYIINEIIISTKKATLVILTESDVSTVLTDKSGTTAVTNLSRRITMRVEHLRSLLELSPRLAELLHENLAENDVVLALESRAEDDGDTVVESAHKQRLVGPVVDDGRLVRLALTTLQTLEVLLEDRREAVALEQTRLHRYLFPVLRQRVEVE